MKMQVLVYIFALAAASASVVKVPVNQRTYIPPDVAISTSNADIMSDRDVQFAYQTHRAYNKLEMKGVSGDYSYGFDIFNATTCESYGQHEIRKGDVAQGTFYRISSGGNRTTVKYTVDTPHGYQASVCKDVQTEVVSQGYWRLGAPIAFAFTPAQAETTLTLVGEEEVGETVSPEARSAYGSRGNVITYFQLRAPYYVNWGHQYRDELTGRTTSQYEGHVGPEGKGRIVFLEEDGTQTSVTTKVNETGYYVTTPVTQTTSASEAPEVPVTSAAPAARVCVGLQ